MSRPSLAEDLADAIAARRPDVHAEALAADLLAADADEHVLVGLVADASRAVYFRPPEWTVRSLPLEDCLDAPHAGHVERERVRRPSEYVADRGPEQWAWLHPRFRWVVAGGDPRRDPKPG